MKYYKTIIALVVVLMSLSISFSVFAADEVLTNGEYNYTINAERNAITIGETNENDTLSRAVLYYDYKPVEYVLGSLDGNSDVSANDALIILKHSAKLELIDENLYEFADVNYDNHINATDALEVLKYAAKVIERFPYKAEESIRILKDYIIENSTLNYNGNKQLYEDFSELVQKELEVEGDEKYNDWLSYLCVTTSIRYLEDLDILEFELCFETKESNNYGVTISFDPSNSEVYLFQLIQLNVDKKDHSIANVNACVSFKNNEVTSNTQFVEDINLSYSGSVFESMSEEEIAELKESLTEELNSQIHSTLNMLNVVIDKYVSLNLKDIGFVNYNILNY